MSAPRVSVDVSVLESMADALDAAQAERRIELLAYLCGLVLDYREGIAPAALPLAARCADELVAKCVLLGITPRRVFR